MVRQAQRTESRAADCQATPRSESRFLSAARACGRTGEPGDAQHASVLRCGRGHCGVQQAALRRRCLRTLGCAERQRAVVELRKVGCKCPTCIRNAMTFIPHSRNKYLMSVFRSRSHSALTGVCTAHPRTRPPQVQPRGSLLRAGACQRPTHESPSGRCRVAAPPATQRGKAGMQIAGRAGCLLQQHMRTVSASFGRLRIQPSGRSCRRACVA